MSTLEFADIDQFLAFIPQQIERQRLVLQKTVTKASSMLYAHARGVYGKHPPLAELADSTKAERARIGGITTDEPLFRTGALLRDNLEARASQVSRNGIYDEATAGIGSNEIINLYHEMGYWLARASFPRWVPARPVFLITAQESEEAIMLMFESGVVDALMER